MRTPCSIFRSVRDPFYQNFNFQEKKDLTVARISFIIYRNHSHFPVKLNLMIIVSPQSFILYNILSLDGAYLNPRYNAIHILFMDGLYKN